MYVCDYAATTSDVQLQLQTLQEVHADACHHALRAWAPQGTCHVTHVTRATCHMAPMIMNHSMYGSLTLQQ